MQNEMKVINRICKVDNVAVIGLPAFFMGVAVTYFTRSTFDLEWPNLRMTRGGKNFIVDCGLRDIICKVFE